MVTSTTVLLKSTRLRLDSLLSEELSFYLKSTAFMTVVGALLYLSLAADYPAVHDAMHDFRHVLAIVPCH